MPLIVSIYRALQTIRAARYDEIFKELDQKSSSMIALCDAPRALQTGFQDPSSPLCAALIALHHEVTYILLFVLSLVSYVLIRLLFSTRSVKPVYFSEHTLLELL